MTVGGARGALRRAQTHSVLHRARRKRRRRRRRAELGFDAWPSPASSPYHRHRPFLPQNQQSAQLASNRAAPKSPRPRLVAFARVWAARAARAVARGFSPRLAGRARRDAQWEQRGQPRPCPGPQNQPPVSRHASGCGISCASGGGSTHKAPKRRLPIRRPRRRWQPPAPNCAACGRRRATWRERRAARARGRRHREPWRRQPHRPGQGRLGASRYRGRRE